MYSSGTFHPFIFQREVRAKEIFDTHLCTKSLEPVNVDAHTRNVTQSGLEKAAPDLFDIAQQHVNINILNGKVFMVSVQGTVDPINRYSYSLFR